MRRNLFGIFTVTVVLALLGASATRAEKESPAAAAEPANAREALSRFNSLIGGWKGVGQLKRNSNSGAWRENSEFVWKIDKKTTGIEYKVKDGKHIKTALIGWDPAAKNITLAAEFADGSKRDYVGQFDKDSLVLESKPAADGTISKVTMKQLSDIRLLVLYEQRRESQTLYSRLGEVGYTREGAKLASSEQTGPVCIVTGGAGTIQVSHKGQTYFVCCTGCRDAFNEDPETYIAEYKAMLEKKKAMKN